MLLSTTGHADLGFSETIVDIGLNLLMLIVAQ